jgi:cathepsin B
MGCNGGQPSGAWNWFTKVGVTSGADYGKDGEVSVSPIFGSLSYHFILADIGSGSSCKPYSLQSCAHHVDPPEGMVACSTLPEYSTPKCKSACSESAYGAIYSNDKHKASSSYSVKTVANMQKELMEKVLEIPLSFG